jgi:hypothetical protein
MWLNSRSQPFFGLYQNVFATSVLPTALRWTEYFGSAYLGEEASSELKIIKSRYCSHLTDEHIKYCLDLCQSNDGPYFNKFATYAVSCIYFAIGKLMKSTYSL